MRPICHQCKLGECDGEIRLPADWPADFKVSYPSKRSGLRTIENVCDDHLAILDDDLGADNVHIITEYKKVNP